MASGSTRTADFKVYFFALRARDCKLMVSGGTRPAGFTLRIKNEDNRLTICCPLYHEVWLNFFRSLRKDQGSPWPFLVYICYLRWKSLEEKLYLKFM